MWIPLPVWERSLRREDHLEEERQVSGISFHRLFHKIKSGSAVIPAEHQRESDGKDCCHKNAQINVVDLFLVEMLGLMEQDAEADA